MGAVAGRCQEWLRHIEDPAPADRVEADLRDGRQIEGNDARAGAERKTHRHDEIDKQVEHVEHPPLHRRRRPAMPRQADDVGGVGGGAAGVGAGDRPDHQPGPCRHSAEDERVSRSTLRNTPGVTPTMAPKQRWKCA